MRLLTRYVTARDLAIGGLAFLATVGVVWAGVVVANELDGSDEPKREAVVDASPGGDVPDSYEQRGTTAFSLSDLPRVHGPFKVLPPGSALARESSYGDSRDNWKYVRMEAKSLEGLPADDIVRLPSLPAGYELKDVVYTIGTSPEGHQQQLSELHMTFSDGIHFDITVSVSRPTEFAKGLPYPVIASDTQSPLVLDVGLVGDEPAIFEFMKPSHEGQGIEEVLVADREFLIVVTSYRGINFNVLTGAARSLVVGRK